MKFNNCQRSCAISSCSWGSVNSGGGCSGGASDGWEKCHATGCGSAPEEAAPVAAEGAEFRKGIGLPVADHAQ